MEVDSVPRGRKKTILPSEVKEESKSPRRPNIIGNAPRTDAIMVPASNNLEKLTLRDIE